MNDAEFTMALYDAVLNAGRHGEVPVQFEEPNDQVLPQRCLSKPWEWRVLGYKVFWFLQIRDRRPPILGRLYQLDAMHNFFPWAHALGMATPQRVSEFVQVLVSAMDAQELGQREAATNPEWARCGEYFNPWADRLTSETPPCDTQPVMSKERFLNELYDSLLARQQENRFPWQKTEPWLPSRDKLHPRYPHFQDYWRWQLKGSRTHWWLEIVDPRYPGSEYPYRIAQDDPAFFESARVFGLVNDSETFIEMGLITAMEENDLGQVQAQAAYDQGASADDPPWIRTARPR